MPARSIKKSRRSAGRTGDRGDLTSSVPSSASDTSAVLNRVAAHYHRCFLEDPRAMEYLRQRGIHNNSLFTDYRIGFSNGTLLNMVPGANGVKSLSLTSSLPPAILTAWPARFGSSMKAPSIM